MVNDEGLRSYKAIAFIKGNPNRVSKYTKIYVKLGAFLRSTVLAKQKTLRVFSVNLGEKLWLK